jgi:cytochrome c oxidase cbb3-type subunit II
MKMTMDVMILGALMVFAAAVIVAVIVPVFITDSDAPSEIFRERTDVEKAGREIYIANGCDKCHSMAVRWLDWGLGAERIAEVGDYVADQPHVLGSERTGPDLSQEGGEHPDDWHLAHFTNPRHTRPDSIMPPFQFLGRDKIDTVTAFVQSLGFKDADARVARQRYWKGEATRAFEAGTDANIKWLHDNVPAPWKKLPNPYGETEASLKRGERVYVSFCIGCHGEVGDGLGPAGKVIYPPPLNFTTLRERLGEDKVGGIFYYQIMNGITGTAMPYFKRDLESEKIWAVGEFVARTFVGVSDANTEPRGIDAAFEGPAGEGVQ